MTGPKTSRARAPSQNEALHSPFEPKPPCVSVIIPAFNAAACLGEALRSCQAQTLRSLEVIVVDDASTDATSQLVESVIAADPRVRLLRNATRLGPAGGRNRALQHAQGEWVAILDADDAYDPDRLAILVSDAEQRNCDMLADNLRVRDRATGGPLGLAFDSRTMTQAEPLSLLQLVAQDNSQTFWSFGLCKPIFRRSFLCEKNLRYDTAAFVGQDFDLYFRAIQLGGRFCVTPQCLYHFSVGGASHSRGRDALLALHRSNARLIEKARSCEPAVRGALRVRGERFAYELLKAALREPSVAALAGAMERLPPPSYVFPKFLSALRRRLFLPRRKHTTRARP